MSGQDVRRLFRRGRGKKGSQERGEEERYHHEDHDYTGEHNLDGEQHRKIVRKREEVAIPDRCHGIDDKQQGTDPRERFVLKNRIKLMEDVGIETYEQCKGHEIDGDLDTG
jgi:hypothetical protein